MPTATEYEIFVAYKLQADKGGPDLFDPTVGNLKVAVVNANPDHTSAAIEHWSDISATQVALGTAYTGPFAAAAVTLAQIGVTENIRLDGDNMVIAEDPGGFTDGIALVWFNDTGNAATSLLMFKQVFGVTFQNTFAQLNINVNANGYWDR